MILVPTDEEKSKENNQRRKHADKVVDSAMTLGANRFRAAAEQSQATTEKPVVDSPAINPDSPFSSAMASMPTVRWGETVAPSYNVNDVFSNRMESTSAPVRDAAQDERLKKMAKFNLIAKGLQTVFGGIIGAQGEVVPGPYDGGMTQQLMNNLQGLDDKYFREMAQWRDQELRAQMFNANQQSQADQVRLQKQRDDVQNLMSQGRYDDAMKAQAAADAYQKEMDAKNYGLRKKGLDLEVNKQFNYGQSNKLQSLDAYNDAIRREQDSLKMLQANYASDEDIKAQSERVQALSNERDQLLRQLSTDKEGFSLAQPSNEANQPTLQDREMNLRSKLSSGGYGDNIDQAKQDVMQLYVESGMDQSAASNAADKYLSDQGFVKKADNKTSDDRNKESLIKEKEGVVTSALNSSMPYLDDPELTKQIVKDYQSGNQEKAVRAVINRLKKDMPTEKQPDYVMTSMGAQPRMKSNKEITIETLEAALQDYLDHKKKYGQR